MIDDSPDYEAIKAQQDCDHDWHLVWSGGSMSDPQEAIEVCRKCGMENPGSYAE